jgi:glycosyltransferase involved in cell wall biosynthesis
MRVLAVTDVSGHQIGGVATAAADLLAGVASAGHEVGLVNDVPYPGTGPFVRQFPAPHPSAAGFARAVGDAMESLRPDVVHLLHMGQRSLAKLLPVLAGRRWLLTVHSISPYERILRALHGHDALHYWARGLMCSPNTVGWQLMFKRRVVPHVVVHSAWMQRVLLGYGQPERATTVIDLASSKAELVPRMQAADLDPSAPHIVTVGGIAHTKGQHDALRAVHMLRDRFPGIRYSMAGEIRDRTYWAYLEALTDDLGLTQAVTFAERLPEPAKIMWLQTADVYLQPSHEEGFCLAYLEAARLSRRLVGTETGAIRQVSEGDGYMRVVSTRDPRAMADAIADLLARPAPSPEALEDRRRRLNERFSVSRYVDAHGALYEAIAR